MTPRVCEHCGSDITRRALQADITTVLCPTCDKLTSTTRITETGHSRPDHIPSSRCWECVQERREHRAEVARLRHRMAVGRLGGEQR